MEAADRLELPANAVGALLAFRAEPKFGPDDATGYVGYLPEEERATAEQELNSLVDRLVSGIEANPTRDFVLSEFQKTFEYFRLSDTEDRERLRRYFEEIMSLVGMKSSDGRLNRMFYGSVG